MSKPHFGVAGFARIRSFPEFTEVWRLQLPLEPSFLNLTKHQAPDTKPPNAKPPDIETVRAQNDGPIADPPHRFRLS